MTLPAARAAPAIVLTTLNAKYIHASLGLRYLLANMGDLRPLTVLREFTIASPAPGYPVAGAATRHPPRCPGTRTAAGCISKLCSIFKKPGQLNGDDIWC